MGRKKKQVVNTIDENINLKEEVINDIENIKNAGNIIITSFKLGYYKLGIYWLEMNKAREFKMEEFEKYKNSQVENDIKKGILKIESR